MVKINPQTQIEVIQSKLSHDMSFMFMSILYKQEEREGWRQGGEGVRLEFTLLLD